MRKLSRGHLVFQRGGNMLLPDHVVERFRPPLAVKRLIHRFHLPAGNKNLYSQPFNAVWTGILHPLCVKFSCRAAARLRKFALIGYTPPRLPGILRL